MTAHTSAGYPEELGGAYALNALPADEIQHYEQYLNQSEQARIEAEELSDTAVALGFATVPVQPSAALRASIMDLIKTTPQLVPLDASTNRELAHALSSAAPLSLVSEATAAPTDSLLFRERPQPLTDASMTALLSGPTTPTLIGANTRASVDIAAVSAVQPSSGAEARAQLRWFQRPGRMLVAASAAVALFVGGTVIGSSVNDTQFVEQQAASLAQINAAPDSQRASTSTGGGQEATLVWSNTLGIAAILVDNLPALPSDKDYQLWYINDSGPLPAGTFDSSGEGTVWRVLDGTMHVGDAVGVTVEPAGGSDSPTTVPIVGFQS